MIQVTVNGEMQEVPETVTLDRFLELFSFPMQRIAVELNNEVIRRTDWPETTINNGDKVEIIHFVGGG